MGSQLLNKAQAAGRCDKCETVSSISLVEQVAHHAQRTVKRKPKANPQDSTTMAGTPNQKGLDLSLAIPLSLSAFSAPETSWWWCTPKASSEKQEEEKKGGRTLETSS